MTADICDHLEKLADMWHGTEHGPDTLDFSGTSKQDHVRAHACLCAYALGTCQSSSETSRSESEKTKSEKRWKNLALPHFALFNCLVLGHTKYNSVQRVYCNPFLEKTFHGSHLLGIVIIRP